ncbi:hypothetical protein [Chengkuizengella sediminis]|uniref:hypothetical protein n=1 Tax=Chengkuizengella sediminis TaxID=1885917 RepID=UPI001389525E|nr:hypothetical protein [Chengkuizengella sediminis]NDI35649.1 hypothetical protein [Chengkuizengella sediminis]
MGIKDEPFVVAQSVSVDDAYSTTAGAIELDPDMPTVVATVDVCVKQPENTQVSLDSMAQIAVVGDPDTAVSFEVTYEIMRNSTTIATINDEMDYDAVSEGRHTNFPNFPVLDDSPPAGINTYDLVCTRVTTNEVEVDNIFVGSRSLKATVITL